MPEQNVGVRDEKQAGTTRAWRVGIAGAVIFG